MAKTPNAAEIMSPCISVCKMSAETGLCLGCHRTLDEIARWSEMSHSQRQSVLEQLNRRTLHVTARSCSDS